MVCKIAHCSAIASAGPGNFIPLLTDVIRFGATPRRGVFGRVRAPYTNIDVDGMDTTTHVQLRLVPGRHPHFRDAAYLAVAVSILKYLSESPDYMAVVGVGDRSTLREQILANNWPPRSLGTV